MGAVGGNVGELSYGSFYLPSIAFGYLSTQPANAFLQYFASINYPLFTIKPSHLLYVLYFLTVVSFLGAIQAHGIARAIYGPDGPSDRPKHSTVHIRHQLGIILGIEPDQVPIVPCRIAQRGFILEILSYVLYLSKKMVASFPESSPQRQQIDHLPEEIPRQHRLEIGIGQLAEFYEVLNWGMTPRILYFVPTGLLKGLTRLSLITLLVFGVLSSFSYAILLLILAHVVLLFRKYFWAPIPNYINPSTLDDRFTPEYKRAKDNQEDHED